ncbi:hypothetical protein RRSWK_05900 [Rhodopirellula sp. SWK7]|nr:hypothetical protein RRSWK_05900 [Rhodopirellula sp. SWK7]
MRASRANAGGCREADVWASEINALTGPDNPEKPSLTSVFRTSSADYCTRCQGFRRRDDFSRMCGFTRFAATSF